DDLSVAVAGCRVSSAATIASIISRKDIPARLEWSASMSANRTNKPTYKRCRIERELRSKLIAQLVGGSHGISSVDRTVSRLFTRRQLRIRRMDTSTSNRGFLAAVFVTVILTWILMAVIGKHEKDKRAAAREAARQAAERSTSTPL